MMGDYMGGREEDSSDFSDGGDHLAVLENDDSNLHSNHYKARNFKVITKESLLAAQREDVQRVMDLLLVREHHSRTLLIHYRWDVEKLISVYIEKGETYMFSAAGVTAVERVDLDLLEHRVTVMCNICMDDLCPTETTKMDCGHVFCNNCWTEHFIVQINEGQSKRIRCMAHECNYICDEAIVKKLVSEKNLDLSDKFDRFLLESYIDDNKMVKWCPSIPHCGNAIRVENDDFCEVQCSCGLQFCFSCLSEAHSPCSCLMWELWTKKFQNESESAKWVAAYTKPCPKCLKPIEKNGGCNSVKCICGQVYCWLCVGSGGIGHHCGRYKVHKNNGVENVESDLRRYVHYFSHYKAHIDSLKQEFQQRKKAKKKVLNLVAWGSEFRDFSWIRNGLSRLFTSRRVLSYSYPFAFYMFCDELFKDEITKEEREIKQNLFEDQQEQLESNVEKLAQLLEVPFDMFLGKKLMETRIKVTNLSFIIDNLCKKMYECIENDLLGSLQFSTHIIAPYQSEGIGMVTDLAVGWSSQPSSINKLEADGQANESTRPSSSRTSTRANNYYRSVEGLEVTRSRLIPTCLDNFIS